MGTELGHWGWPVAQGTLTDGFHKLAPLFLPLVRAMYEKQMSERLFHGDETGWKVFEPIEGKVGYRWYLWVTQSPSVVFYRMAPGRGADVPKRHFAALAGGRTEVILVCDRYVAYKCLAEEHGVIVLAFCWAHVRRDFLDTARRCPPLEAWMLGWVEDIGELYRLNAQRLEVWDETRSLAEQPPAFLARHEALREKRAQMQARRDESLGDNELPGAQQAVLKSLKNHWQGLTVFVDYPQVAMDNNTAERSVRNPAVGRKN